VVEECQQAIAVVAFPEAQQLATFIGWLLHKIPGGVFLTKADCRRPPDNPKLLTSREGSLPFLSKDFCEGVLSFPYCLIFG
jgi:hypothetical protein